MKIQMRYFAIVRELLGAGSETIEAPVGSTAGDVLSMVLSKASRLVRAERSIMLMVNEEYVGRDHVLEDGDELALIPPVSGGSDLRQSGRFLVTTAILDPRAIEEQVAGGSSGAIVTFSGTVRNNARGKTVTAIEYEAYPPAAEKMLVQIGDEIRARWGVDRVAISHRFGLLRVGETSVVISVSAPHRALAFDACRYAIERIKEIVPIWKKEIYEDGAVWIGSEADYQREVADTQ